MQFGGDDQWSNMLAGTELICKKTGKDAYAMTITLLMNSEGNKMGKTAKGAVWLDPNKTSPFEFYQYWRNIDDADVMKCLRLLTFIPVETIEEMDNWDDSRINEKKEILAYELTSMIHGKDEADKAKQTSLALFAGDGDDSNMPTTTVSEDSLSDGQIGILDLLVMGNLAKNKGEARRLIDQGGITLNGEKVTSSDEKVTSEALRDGIKIKKGKKVYHKFVL